MDMILALLQEYPWFGSLVAVMGMARLIFKPLFTLIDTIVTATPNKEDDKAWGDVKNSQVMSTFLWLVDYIASVKIPKKPK